MSKGAIHAGVQDRGSSTGARRPERRGRAASAGSGRSDAPASTTGGVRSRRTSEMLVIRSAASHIRPSPAAFDAGLRQPDAVRAALARRSGKARA